MRLLGAEFEEDDIEQEWSTAEGLACDVEMRWGQVKWQCGSCLTEKTCKQYSEGSTGLQQQHDYLIAF